MGEVPDESIKFICSYCKCEFIADKGEYSKHYLRMEDVILYTIDCPCCSKYVLVRQKPSY
jgi:hypothetical protein